MYREIFIISLCCVTLGVSYHNHDIIFKPCREYDDNCITGLSRRIFSMVKHGVPELGVKPADPMKQKHMEGNLSLLKYTLTNSTIIGFRNCEITKATINFKSSVLCFKLTCPHFLLVGDYDINGILIVVPIEGNGKYSIEVKDYDVSVDIDILFTADKYGTKYLKLKSFRADGDLEGGMIFDLKNLFNGRKELGDIVNKFANDNWKPVSKELQGPVFNANIKTLLKSFNKILKHIPVEQILLSTPS